MFRKNFMPRNLALPGTREIRRTLYKYHKQTPEEKEEADNGKFKYFSSPIVERVPVLTPNAPDWYSEWFLSHIEFHQKYGRNYSYDDIVQKMQDMRKDPKSKKAGKKAVKKGEGGRFVVNETKLRKQIGMSPLDPGKQRQFDVVLEKRKKMEHNPRLTFYDKLDDRRQLYRALDRSLYLLVEKHRSEEPWQFPLAVWDGEETMRQTAERAVLEEFGTKFLVYFLGNHPEGHWVHRFDDSLKERTGFDGYKIFYYRAIMLGGEMDFNSEITHDFAWSTKSQLAEYLPKEQCVLHQHMLTF